MHRAPAAVPVLLQTFIKLFSGLVVPAAGAFGVFAADIDGEGDEEMAAITRNDNLFWYEFFLKGIYKPGFALLAGTAATAVARC